MLHFSIKKTSKKCWWIISSMKGRGKSKRKAIFTNLEQDYKTRRKLN